MQNIIITTQYMENYGAHDWDGTGECPQYWKMKGGEQHLITDIDVNENLKELVRKASTERGWEHSSDYSREYILDWYVTDKVHTSFEEDQLEYEGIIRYPAQRIAASELR